MIVVKVLVVKVQVEKVLVVLEATHTDVLNLEVFIKTNATTCKIKVAMVMIVVMNKILR